MPRLSSGPAMAMRISRAGSGLRDAKGALSMMLTPPSGSSTMERTGTPLRIATTE